jgi:two-component system cell cycle sensor histidine kinase/response regulator CckA
MEQELGYGWTSVVHVDDLDDCLATYSSCCDARRSYHMEYRLRRTDGEYRFVSSNGVPRFAPNGTFAGYIASCVDITDLKRAQEAALARRKLESMGRMASGIAHDFNNILGTILASVDLAAMASDEGSSYAEELERINTAAIRGTELVRELMTYAGHESPVFELLEVQTVVNEMVHLLRVAISKHLTLKIDLPEDLPALRASPTQLRQVVMNLITNASDAIGDWPGEIYISGQAVKLGNGVSIVGGSGLSRGDYLRLQVCDTGCGMSPEVQARIFDPFFSTKDAGRGLGLAVVQGIIRSHGGAITVASELARGTTFEIFLPCASAMFRNPK